ncbi:MAG: SPOR domain-containing protein [Gammaproteobacteria bacterium]|nr:SPOR domain-containing protein [Gammaproteobacteria bacterium]
MTAKHSSSPWVWVSLLLLLGMFAAFVIFLDQKLVKGNESPAAETARQSGDKPRIDFYSVLPGRTVDIPISEQDQQAIENPSINKAVAENIILQVGSFQSATEADSLKAQLAFLGLEADIKSAVVNDGTWYRVMLGPFAANSELSRAINRLIENDIDYMQRSAKP